VWGGGILALAEIGIWILIALIIEKHLTTGVQFPNRRNEGIL